MRKRITLSAEDCKRVARLSESAAADPEGYVNQRIEAWKKFVVQEVEPGYEFTIYDYQNDLDGRKIIEEILQVLSPEGRRSVEAVLRPIDERFKRATFPLKHSVWLPNPGLNQWWYCRAPKRMGDDLERDLRADGLID